MADNSRPFMNPLSDTLNPGNMQSITNSKHVNSIQASGNPSNLLSYIDLQVKDKGSFRLTSNELEKWFADAASSLRAAKPDAPSSLRATNKKTPANVADPNKTTAPTQLLSLYGLKSPRDVIAFLHSAAGRSARGMASKLLAEKESQKAILRQEAMDRQIKRQRRLVFALLGMASKNAQAKKSLYELIQRQIDKKLKKPKVNQGQSKSQKIRGLSLAQANNAYAHSAEALQDELQEKNQQLSALQTELNDIQQQENAIAQRYDTMDNHLAETDAQIEKALSPELTQQDVIASMENRIARLEAKIAQPNNREQKAELESQLTALKARCEHCKNNNFTITESDRVEVLQDNLERTGEKLLLSTDQTMELTAQNRHREAEASLSTMQALHAQAGNLQDSIDVLNKEKFLYNSAGEKVDSLNDADYILSRNEKIVNENGKSYLLRSTQEFADLSVEEKNQAQESFDANRSNFSSLQNLVNRNKTVEIALCDEKKMNVTNRCNAVQEEINLLQNQRNNIQANQATIRTGGMGNADLGLSNPATAVPLATAAPTPSPTISSSQHIQSTTTPSPAPNMAKSIPQMIGMNNQDSLNSDLLNNPSQRNLSSVPLNDMSSPNAMKTFTGAQQQSPENAAVNLSRNPLNNAGIADPKLQPQINKIEANKEISNKLKESVNAALKTAASRTAEKEPPKNTNSNTPNPFSTRLGPDRRG